MIANMVRTLDFDSKALVLRAERQRIIASNIANADTPGYAARDLDFKAAMNDATGNSQDTPRMLANRSTQGGYTLATAHARHIPLPGIEGGSRGDASNLAYTTQSQPTADSNSVDLDRERANFTDNSVRYEATLRFINGRSKTLLSAIQGQ
jgi:flagellar basal-body rod protein FlgB